MDRRQFNIGAIAAALLVSTAAATKAVEAAMLDVSRDDVTELLERNETRDQYLELRFEDMVYDAFGARKPADDGRLFYHADYYTQLVIASREQAKRDGLTGVRVVYRPSDLRLMPGPAVNHPANDPYYPMGMYRPGGRGMVDHAHEVVVRYPDHDYLIKSRRLPSGTKVPRAKA